MPNNFYINKRDLEFVLFEQLKVQDLQETERYQDFGQDVLKMILSEGAKFSQEVLGPLNQDADRIGAVYKDGEVTMPPGNVVYHGG